jgi:hypothetical protein
LTERNVDMDNIRRHWCLGAIAAVGLGLLATGGSRGSGPEPEKQKSLFVKAGHYYINLTKIRYAIDSDNGLEIVLGPGNRDHLKLTGGEADTIRYWLDVHRFSGGPSLSVDPQAPEHQILGSRLGRMNLVPHPAKSGRLRQVFLDLNLPCVRTYTTRVHLLLKG